MNKSFDEFKSAIGELSSLVKIAKLKLKKGDLLVCTMSTDVLSGEDIIQDIEKIDKLVKSLGLDILVIYMDSDCSLKKVSEKEMNNIGWYRKKKGIK